MFKPLNKLLPIDWIYGMSTELGVAQFMVAQK
jgi:hypothetical protein